jgi:RHS repeat-associated protein
MSVDGVGTAHPSFYGSSGISGKNGCTLSSAPALYAQANWTAGAYTSCATYDGKSALPTNTTNAFGQTSSTSYDNTQGELPSSSTDANGQTTQLTYSYDSNGNLTVQTSEPGDAPPSYTTQTKHISTCTTSSSLPCFEIDSNGSLYPGAVTRSFYDALGRQVETRRPGPDDGYDTIVYTVYNDAAHSVFQSEPFEVAAGSSWLDPNGATDKNGHSVYGAVTFYDALGRVIATQDLLFNAGSSSGINCNPLGARATTCVIYKLDNVSSLTSDNNTYETTRSVDANNHVTESLADVLGHVRYVETYSGTQGNSPTVNSLSATQYNVLGEPTSVTVTDESPHNSQTVTSISTTMQYDNLGRLTKVFDPDRGTHTYTYNADNQLTSDSAGGRTIGYNYDLLGRPGCEQSGSATIDADGSCTSGTQPLVQNTYDSNVLGTQGTDDFPLGRLTKSVATTYYPEGTSLTTTQKWQYDARGRVSTAQLKFGLPSAWNVSTALPTYQQTLSYTDADQPETTTTSILNQSGQGYSFSQVYDQTLGLLTGLSTGSTTSANLASLNYNVHDLLSKISYQTSSGSNLAYAQLTYDGDLRPQEESYTWQGGSGQSGQFFDQARSYDAASNVTGATTTIGSNSESANYCYDEQNRLVWAGNSGTQPAAGNGTCGSLTLSNSFPGASYNNAFTYTHLGQLWQAPLNGTGSTQQYLYCSSNSHQLQGAYPTGATCANPGTATSSAQYDAWGNLTSRTYTNQTATLSYDPFDQLVGWQVPGTNQAWYGYDSNGQRSIERSSIGSTTSLTVYAFGLEEYHYDGSGTLQSSTHYYTLAGRLLGELQVNGSTQTTNFFLSDGLGSVLGVFSNTANSASILASQLYYPYGASRYGSGTVSPYITRGFTGQDNDPTSGLDYYGARYYDPVVGLFVSTDKKLGNVQGVNPYEYVGNNPETNNDPTGEMYAPPPGSQPQGNPPPTNPPTTTTGSTPSCDIECGAIVVRSWAAFIKALIHIQFGDFPGGIASVGSMITTVIPAPIDDSEFLSLLGKSVWYTLTHVEPPLSLKKFLSPNFKGSFYGQLERDSPGFGGVLEGITDLLGHIVNAFGAIASGADLINQVASGHASPSSVATDLASIAATVASYLPSLLERLGQKSDREFWQSISWTIAIIGGLIWLTSNFSPGSASPNGNGGGKDDNRSRSFGGGGGLPPIPPMLPPLIPNTESATPELSIV